MAKGLALSLVFSLCYIVAGCKTSSTQGALKHDFGQLSTSPHELDCVQASYSGAEAQVEKYVRGHIARIIAANRARLPAMFVPEKFCVNVLDSRMINAAGRDNGMVTVFIGAIKGFDNDADFAAVFSHEIAHIINSAEYLIAPKELTGDQAYQAILTGIKGDLDYLANTDEKIFIKTLAPVTDKKGADTVKRAELYGNLMYYYFKRLTQLDVPPDPYQQILNVPHQKQWDPSSEDFYSSNINLALYAEPQILNEVQYVRGHLLNSFTADELPAFLAAEKNAVAQEFVRVQKTADLANRGRQKDRYEKKVMGNDQSANWKEQSADEIGYEMYLRAGFAKEEFPKMFYKMRVYNEKLKGMPTDNINISKDEQHCQRGHEEHPELCWRLLDLDREWVKHHDEYEKLTTTDAVLDVFGDALAQLKVTYKDF